MNKLFLFDPNILIHELSEIYFCLFTINLENKLCNTRKIEHTLQFFILIKGFTAEALAFRFAFIRLNPTVFLVPVTPKDSLAS